MYMFWVFKLSFVVDTLAFLTSGLFGLFFKKIGKFFFLSSGHSVGIPLINLEMLEFVELGACIIKLIMAVI
jgi:hypothetical protein